VTAALTPAQFEAAQKAARAQLWRLGNLRFKLHETQEKIYDAIEASGRRRYFLLCSRRLGKSYMLLCKAFEQALRQPDSRILWVAPFAKDAADVATDLANSILEDCPADLRPEYKAQPKEYHFKNGSIIRFKGVNNENAQNLRGGATHLVILDECGLMDDLGRVLRSVIEPMTLGKVKGRIYLATTPPESPGHDSFTIHETMAAQGLVSSFTLNDAPHIDDEDKYNTLINCGEKAERIPDILLGKAEPETTVAKREYYTQWVTDANSAVVPEFDAKARAEIVKEWPTPEYRDCYVFMDPGFVDATGALFAYWDFAKARLVIEDELILHHANTPQIAEAIFQKEKELWGEKAPFMRVSDVDKRLIADLAQIHGLVFAPADKRDSKAGIHKMRGMVHNRELVILPKCKGLVRQLTNAVFNKKATDFAQGDEIDKHFDLVAALKYGCKGFIPSRNPYPAGYGRPGFGVWPGRGGRGGGGQGGAPKQEGLLGNTPLGKRLRKAGY
jgi:hypothetical protein